MGSIKSRQRKKAHCGGGSRQLNSDPLRPTMASRMTRSHPRSRSRSLALGDMISSLRVMYRDEPWAQRIRFEMVIGSTHTHMAAHTLTCTRAHASKHTGAHTHTHTHTHTRPQPPSPLPPHLRAGSVQNWGAPPGTSAPFRVRLGEHKRT